MKTGCRNIEKLISDEMDGVLGQTSREVLMTHLDTCTGCKSLRDNFVMLHNQLQLNIGSEATPVLNESFDRRFFARLEQETANPYIPVVQFLRSRLLPVLAVLLLASGLIIVKPLGRKELTFTDTAGLNLAGNFSIISAAICKLENEENRQLADRQAKEILYNIL